MCIINETAKVSATSILVSKSRDGMRQFVAYANKVMTSVNNNAMILPVPYPETLKFHNLQHYKELFDDCSNSFPLAFKSRSLCYDSNLHEKTLKVFNVGSYWVSVCVKLSDFDRVDRNVFSLNPTVKNLFIKHYDGRRVPFGYIVCKLKTGLTEEQYHPLGYSHRIYNSKGYLFVPTRHYHGDHDDGEGNNADWDHEIYSVNTTDHALQLNESVEPCRRSGECMVKFKKIVDFAFPPLSRFNLMELHGIKRNCDIYLTDYTAEKSQQKKHEFLGIDGCIFTHNSNNIMFAKTSLATMPMWKQYYLSIPNFGMKPTAFFGERVVLHEEAQGLRVIDDYGLPQQQVYFYPFSSVNPSTGCLVGHVYNEHHLTPSIP